MAPLPHRVWLSVPRKALHECCHILHCGHLAACYSWLQCWGAYVLGCLTGYVSGGAGEADVQDGSAVLSGSQDPVVQQLQKVRRSAQPRRSREVHWLAAAPPACAVQPAFSSLPRPKLPSAPLPAAAAAGGWPDGPPAPPKCGVIHGNLCGPSLHCHRALLPPLPVRRPAQRITR